MKYDVFSLLEKDAVTKEQNETEQEFMTRILTEVFSGEESVRVNDKLAPEFVSCSVENRELCVRFAVQEWMLNPHDTLHGGMLSTAVDVVMCVLGRYLAKKQNVVTAQLSMNFMRAIQKGDTFTVHAVADHVGRRSIMVHAYVTANDSNKPAATATAVLM